MNSKCVITGHTRGIGRVFADHFESKGWEVVGFNTTTGLDKVIETASGCELFINNAYADGMQINFLNQLHDKVGKMIVCGSVAAFYPDNRMPIYSNHKKILWETYKSLSKPNILMLNLSAKGYNDRECLLKIVDFWLEYPVITEISFDPTGKPNE